MESMESLIGRVENWGEVKGLIKPENAIAQTVKVMEELGETAGAILKKDRVKIVDGIGDVTVTLILLAKQNNLTLQECLEAAWEEIKDRTGNTNEQGIFIKD